MRPPAVSCFFGGFGGSFISSRGVHFLQKPLQFFRPSGDEIIEILVWPDRDDETNDGRLQDKIGSTILSASFDRELEGANPLEILFQRVPFLRVLFQRQELLNHGRPDFLQPIQEIWLPFSFPESYDSRSFASTPFHPTTAPPGPFQGFPGNTKPPVSAAEPQETGLSRTRKRRVKPF